MVTDDSTTSAAPDTLLTANWALLTLFCAFAVSTAIVALLPAEPDLLLATASIEVACYAVPVLAIARFRRYPLSLVFGTASLRKIALYSLTVLATVALLLVTAKLSDLIQQFWPSSEDENEWIREFLTPLGGGTLALALFSVAVVPGFCEELFFRGALQPALIRNVGPSRGIVITGLLFAAIHLNLRQFPALLVLGVFLGFLSYRTGSFVYAAIAHALNNALAILSATLDQTPGNPAGTEGMPLYLAIAGLVGLVVFVRMLLSRTAHPPPAGADLNHI